jgi:hypothetical protein
MPKNDEIVKLEVWDAGKGQAYLYTELWETAKQMKEQFGRGTVYQQNGRAIAWQFKIPKRLVRFLTARFGGSQRAEEEISQKMDVVIQRVTETGKSAVRIWPSKE